MGAKGQLGHELISLLRERQDRPSFCALDYEEVDITQANAIRDMLQEKRPRIVINAAAYTDVDGCESHEDRARAVNTEAPGYIARACKELGCRFIHISTDFVFDGAQQKPYQPDDPVNPLSIYGRTKADGEQQVRRLADDYVIVRTSWLFSSFGNNFVKTMLRLAGERDELRVVNDQIGSPTYARDLADALLSVGRDSFLGTYHFCNEGMCSRYDFTRRILQQTRLEVKLSPISSDQLPLPAQRPFYSVLSPEKLSHETGLRIRRWQDALDECLGRLWDSGYIARPEQVTAKDV